MGVALGRQAHHLVGVKTISVIVKVDLDRRDLSQTSKINCMPHGRSVNMDVNDKDAFAVDITDCVISDVNVEIQTITLVRVKIAHVPRVTNLMSMHNANVLVIMKVLDVLVSTIAFHNMVVDDKLGRIAGDIGKTIGHLPDGRHISLMGGDKHDRLMKSINDAITHVYRIVNGHMAKHDVGGGKGITGDQKPMPDAFQNSSLNVPMCDGHMPMGRKCVDIGDVHQDGQQAVNSISIFNGTAITTV